MSRHDGGHAGVHGKYVLKLVVQAEITQINSRISAMGDPVSSYIFISRVEILALLVRKDKKILEYRKY